MVWRRLLLRVMEVPVLFARMRLSSVILLLGLFSPAAPAAPAAFAAPPVVLDPFDDISGWQAAPSDGVTLSLASDAGQRGRSMRMDFDFRGHAGWATARRVIRVDLPANYRFTFRMRGETPPNTLELKFIDASGENVWWVRKAAWEFPRDWSDVVADKRRIEFAWGPSPTKTLERVAFIEVTVTAATGGKGRIWLDELTFEELPVPRPTLRTPSVTASSHRPGFEPAQAMDGNSGSAWRSAVGGPQALSLDFGEREQVGGLVIDWGTGEHATSYDVELSDDGEHWRKLRTVQGGNGGRDYLQLHEAEARLLRLSLHAGAGAGASYAIREITEEPPRFGTSWIAVYQRMARDNRRGLYPRGLLGEFAYWTMFGVDGDEGQKPLLSEDGAIETSGGFTVEPFVRLDGRLLTWADVETDHALEEASLPLPSTTWRHPKFSLEIAPFASGEKEEPVMYARYRLRNLTPYDQRAQLSLAVRPLRVTPPWHELNIPELTAPIRRLAWSGKELLIDGTWHLVPSSAPTGVALATFDQGDATEILDAASEPITGTTPRSVEDPQRHASAALTWDVRLAPGAQRDVVIAMPLHPGRVPILNADQVRNADQERAAAIRSWKETLRTVDLSIPAAPDLVETARANVAYILVGRDGPAIRGGPRNYDRSWIRDGCLSSAMLLRFGLADQVRDYIRWFAPYQFDDGKVPCCVDARGADPVPEHDSHGEFIYLVTTYARLTGDRKLAREMWPRVDRAVRYLDHLRQQRRSDAYRSPDKAHYFGLLPPSISHEGYSAKPMHSYWDDFWALRGLRDAAWLAGELGRADDALRIAAIRDEFARDLSNSIERSLEVHRISYIPGAADLGDFDATSTTIAIDPGGELSRLPQPALMATFERYWEEAEARMEGRKSWTVYTPYEVRQVGTFVRLGWRDRALRLLAFLLDDRRPPGWKNWAEVVAQSYRAPIYLGDIPHLWVASDFVRSLIDMIMYEEEESLVLGAGLAAEWLDQGVAVRGLRTYWGPLDFEIRAEPSAVTAQIKGVRVPADGVVLVLPFPVRSATVNGREVPVQEGRIVVRQVPAEVKAMR